MGARRSARVREDLREFTGIHKGSQRLTDIFEDSRGFRGRIEIQGGTHEGKGGTLRFREGPELGDIEGWLDHRSPASTVSLALALEFIYDSFHSGIDCGAFCPLTGHSATSWWPVVGDDPGKPLAQPES